MATGDQLQRDHISKVGAPWGGKPKEDLNVSRGPGGASAQAIALRREGVVVSAGHLGELSIDLSTYGWFPNSLPSEEVEERESEREE